MDLKTMELRMSNDKQLQVPGNVLADFFAPAFEYTVDAVQRSVLFADVMRQRGNQYLEHLTEKVPHVLDYAAELVLDLD